MATQWKHKEEVNTKVPHLSVNNLNEIQIQMRINKKPSRIYPTQMLCLSKNFANDPHFMRILDTSYNLNHFIIGIFKVTVWEYALYINMHSIHKVLFNRLTVASLFHNLFPFFRLPSRLTRAYPLKLNSFLYHKKKPKLSFDDCLQVTTS